MTYKPNPTKFTVTDNHIKLARRMYVSWEDCEFGAPSIDCKRPYGNSDVIGDIAEIIGYPLPDEDDVSPGEYDELRDKAYADLRPLHEEMQHVLQIALATGSFEPGDYECDQYRDNWRRVS